MSRRLPARPGDPLASRLAARLAHDLNNVIGVLSGHLYLLRLGGDDPEESYGEIEKAVAQLERMAGRLGRLGTLGTEHVGVFDLNEVVRSVVDERSGQVALGLESDLPGISGRRGDVAAALRELLDNACRAVASGGEVRVVTRRSTASADLIVEDSGAGLDPAARARLFEPFFSGAARKGEGLGLTVVGAVAAMHGASCEVAERRGGGTRVLLRFPVSGSQTSHARPSDRGEG